MFRVWISDRMETQKFLFWEGEDFLEQQAATMRAQELIKWLGIDSSQNSKYYTHKVTIYEPGVN